MKPTTALVGEEMISDESESELPLADLTKKPGVISVRNDDHSPSVTSTTFSTSIALIKEQKQAPDISLAQLQRPFPKSGTDASETSQVKASREEPMEMKKETVGLDKFAVCSPYGFHGSVLCSC